MSKTEIDDLIILLAKLPGLGPRSARRVALHLLRKRESLMIPLSQKLSDIMNAIKTCPICGNLDTDSPCNICSDFRRDQSIICVVEDVGDLWALERSALYKGLYHVLGGTLSALDGIGPDELHIPKLVERASQIEVKEVILATNATIDGQSTAHYIAKQLADANSNISGLAHGVPIGGELDYLDDGTLLTALNGRKPVAY
ncbi:MAG: Recombination protein RecR [Alphaproteobacteria bacterium MarineAlpha3_Bin5]|nr:recombination protein RecR [Magnetovibrio sp.]PPR76172.1 MAG: Recombination protein RecR [Alphaproteobacteria bacterium MarineAlpha3_Bin5]